MVSQPGQAKRRFCRQLIVPSGMNSYRKIAWVNESSEVTDSRM
jgi:hypothetical protein